MGNSRVILKRCSYVVTLDREDRVETDVDIVIDDGVIVAIGSSDDERQSDLSIDGRGRVVYPGLINTHHHLYQSFSRGWPAVQSLTLFAWLKRLYDVWVHLDEEVVYYAALTGLAALCRHGATTVVDHHYVFNHDGCQYLDRLFDAADALGVRLVATRGSMSRGVDDGGLPPMSVVQDEDVILAETEDAIRRHHDAARGAYHQMVVAPCSPFSVSPSLMRDSAALARRYGVRLHTHLAETKDETAYVMATEGMRPLAYMESLDWVGPDVWYAHGVWFNDEEIDTLARTQTGIAHCPVSNMKLASGVCPVPALLARGVPLGLAVDGSASNDGSNLMAEMRQGYLLHRLTSGDAAPDGYTFLSLATRGGARLIGRSELGSLAVGQMGDCCLIRLDDLDFVGATSDPRSWLAVVGYDKPVERVLVGGEVVVADGRLTRVDEARLYAEADACWRRYARRSGLMA